MSPIRPTRAALAAALLAACCHAMAGNERPLLPDTAFRAVQACSLIDPFADTNPERQERIEAWSCKTEAPLKMAVRTPRLKPTDTGPDAVELEMDGQVSLRRPGFTGVARFGMQAATQADYRLQPRRHLLAASGSFRLTEELALDLGLGQEVLPAPRSRATATAIYRPEGRHLVYLQVAQEEGALGPAVGMRWWLSPGGALLDLSARRAADDSIEPRFGLRWTH